MTGKTIQMDMGTVLESQLREFSVQGVVRHMRIVRRAKDDKSKQGGDRFGYELLVQLTWKEQEDILITYNSKRPRTWANLDRMAHHIDTEYKFHGTIFLQL